MRFSRPLQGLMLGAGGLLLASLAHGQEPGAQLQPPTPVLVEVMVGYVSARPGPIDPRAAELAKMLGREFMTLQTLRVIQMQQLQLVLRQRGQVELPTGHFVSMQPEEFTPHGLRMGVEVQGMLRTHLNIPNGNQVVIGAYNYEDGRLVVRLAPTFQEPAVSPEGR